MSTRAHAAPLPGAADVHSLLSAGSPDLRLRTNISACCSTTRACSFAALRFSHARVSVVELEPAAVGVAGSVFSAANPPVGNVPAVFTRCRILIACSVHMPILSITRGLWSASIRQAVRVNRVGMVFFVIFAVLMWCSVD